MPDEVRFLAVEHVRRAHIRAMNHMGEAPQPLGSVERLEGALSRMPFAARYRESSVIELAALTAIAISQAQAFLVGINELLRRLWLPSCGLMVFDSMEMVCRSPSFSKSTPISLRFPTAVMSLGRKVCRRSRSGLNRLSCRAPDTTAR